MRGAALCAALLLCGGAWAETFLRDPGPVLRDPIPGAAYEVASDPHVTGDAMVYAGDDGGRIAIKLARRDGAGWRPDRVLIGSDVARPRFKETPYHRVAADGTHEIWFIGYDDEAAYRSEVFVARAAAIDGPYRVVPDPVVRLGTHDGHPVRVITSPSVVAHEGRLHLVFLGWDGFEDVTVVRSFGAVSDDGGRTWSAPEVVDVPIGMEGAVTPASGGGFVAARTVEHGSGGAVALSDADHPFGPWVPREGFALVQAGLPWEADEIIGAQVAYEAGRPVLYYTGADHAKGWWVMRAEAR